MFEKKFHKNSFKKIKKKMKKLISFLAFFILIMVTGFFGYLYYINSKVENLEKELIKLMSVHTPLKFKIYDKKGDSLFIKVKYYDLENNEIANKNYKIKGKELAFDFYVFTHKSENYAFPYSIFTDQVAPKKGLNIAKDYNSNGFPQIFYFKNIEKKHFEFLLQKYEQILGKNLTFGNDFGNTLHDVKELKQFEINVVYKFIVHSKGGIEVLED